MAELAATLAMRSAPPTVRPAGPIRTQAAAIRKTCDAPGSVLVVSGDGDRFTLEELVDRLQTVFPAAQLLPSDAAFPPPTISLGPSFDDEGTVLFDPEPDLSGDIDDDLDGEYSIGPASALFARLNVVYGLDTMGRGSLVPFAYSDRYGPPDSWTEDDHSQWAKALSDWDVFADPPTDFVPMEDRIDPDWAIKTLIESFPYVEFWEDKLTNILCADLAICLDGDQIYRSLTADEAIYVGYADESSWYLDPDQRGKKLGEVRASVVEHLEDISHETRSERDLLETVFRSLTRRSPEGLTDDELAEVLQGNPSFKRVVSRVYPSASILYWGWLPTPTIVAQGESRFVEFKETARWNLHANRQDKVIEDLVVKTVAAFMNAAGGTLLIGVNDAGEVTGLGPDLKLFGGSIDRYENWLMGSLLGGALSKSAVAENVQPSFSHDVCRLDVYAASREVFARTSDSRPRLFVRMGNATHEFEGEDITEYVRDHWPRRG